MIKEEEGQQFAEQWIRDWNQHDLPAILSHYAEEIQFHSPFISLLHFNEAGVLNGKEELQRYFQIGLETYPDLYFQLHEVFVGVSSLVLHYTSVKGKKAAEVLEFNQEWKVFRVVCHYVPDTNL